MAKRIDLSEVNHVKTRRRIEHALRLLPHNEEGACALVDCADRLGVEVATFSERPNFGPEQVRCFHQLVAGGKYYLCYTDDKRRYEFRLMGSPYRDGEDWWIEFRAQDPQLLRGFYLSLAEHGVIPNKEGEWCNDSYLAFTEENIGLADTTCPACNPVTAAK